MWRRLLRSRETDDDRDRFVIAPHHPDRLRRPAISPAAAPDERLYQALTWNVFRTLELITPSFWLRRLHLRLSGELTLVPCQTARIRLWSHLPRPPIQRLDGAVPDVLADVFVETEHAVWALMVESPGRDPADAEAAAALVDATAWRAGAREHHCGVIETGTSGPRFGGLMRDRYCRSRESARLRSGSRGPTAPAIGRWGGLQWPELAALLQDCCNAPSLPEIERVLARHALEWAMGIGIDPQPTPAQPTPALCRDERPPN